MYMKVTRQLEDWRVLGSAAMAVYCEWMNLGSSEAGGREAREAKDVIGYQMSDSLAGLDGSCQGWCLRLG